MNAQTTESTLNEDLANDAAAAAAAAGAGPSVRDSIYSTLTQEKPLMKRWYMQAGKALLLATGVGLVGVVCYRAGQKSGRSENDDFNADVQQAQGALTEAKQAINHARTTAMAAATPSAGMTRS